MLKYIILAIIIVFGFILIPRFLQSSPDFIKNKTGPAKEIAVPLPTAQDTIRAFFNLINEQRGQEALKMMTDEMKGEEDTEKVWLAHFEAIERVEVVKITPYDEQNWDNNTQTYQAILNVTVSEDAKNLPIPYYGWGENPNLRWISLERQNSTWHIAAIATGF